MSLQRVFESARKMGIPVIVTDPSGRDPMVVLPLEQFEAMNEVGGGRSVEKAPEMASPRTVPINFEAPIQKSEENRPNPSVGLSPEVQESFNAIVMESPEIPLEERFYLEPMDDGTGR